MFWFSRRQGRKVPRKGLRLEVEQLEGRLVPGLTWTPATAIDILGITSPGTGPYVVAGEWIDFQIDGSGEDWDDFAGPIGNTGSAQDSVSITWSGASCFVSGDGKTASCQIGNAGSGSVVDIFVSANDAGALPGGDDGSRDDPAVNVATQKTGLWVTITGKFSGQLDDDNNLTFYGATDPQGKPQPVDDARPRETGPTDPTTAAPGTTYGFYSKMELTGTVAPAVANGTGDFLWKQRVDTVMCARDRMTGEWTGRRRVLDQDDPGPIYQQTATVNNKVFSIDAPGLLTTNVPGLADMDRVYQYKNLTTHVRFEPRNRIASALYQWHLVNKIEFDVANGQWVRAVPANAGDGHITLPPADCSKRP